MLQWSRAPIGADRRDAPPSGLAGRRTTTLQWSRAPIGADRRFPHDKTETASLSGFNGAAPRSARMSDVGASNSMRHSLGASMEPRPDRRG